MSKDISLGDKNYRHRDGATGRFTGVGNRIGINSKLPVADADALKQAARARGIGLSTLVRTILVAWIRGPSS